MPSLVKSARKLLDTHRKDMRSVESRFSRIISVNSIGIFISDGVLTTWWVWFTMVGDG